MHYVTVYDVGVVMQNTDLFGGTILENITYGLSPDQVINYPPLSISPQPIPPPLQ